MKRLVLALLLALTFLSLTGSAQAQTYSFEIPQEIVHVYWNADGSASLDYLYTFRNEDWASPIDFVDIGLPNPNYDLNTIFADVDGQPVNQIETSPYVTYGVAVDLGAGAIPPGETGTVHVFVGTIDKVLYPDDQDNQYVSAVFSPNWFDAKFVNGTTDITVIFHLPLGVSPDQPRWHTAPSGWPAEPDTALDEEGRPTYTWRNPVANSYTQYLFGASFPLAVVPDQAVVRPDPLQPLFDFFEGLVEFLPALGCIGFIGFFVVYSLLTERRRQLQYLPPKISIEGHGIKRGLTAVEAAILMEQPMDKILTMILFGVLKKGAAHVVTRQPLKLELSSPLPEGLHEYETDYLAAFDQTATEARRKALQEMMVKLVNSLSQKMKGFSRRETTAYYRDIVKRAWAQVEAADTPEVRSEKYDEVMEWTMLDRDYDDRTRDVFRHQPVILPVWWGRYDPGYRTASTPSSAPVTAPTPSAPGKAGTSLPHLPGSDFAASIVNSVQTMSASAVGSVQDFTRTITNRTNPVPKSSSTSSRSTWKSGGGGGGTSCACACACACAGCACACAGGGR